jgi:hypothetical protein
MEDPAKIHMPEETQKRILAEIAEQLKRPGIVKVEFRVEYANETQASEAMTERLQSMYAKVKQLYDEKNGNN